MNQTTKDKIRELWTKVCQDEMPELDQTCMTLARQEKFAGLIVQELCTVLDEAQWEKGEDWICSDGTRIISKVRTHFGIE